MMEGLALKGTTRTVVDSLLVFLCIRSVLSRALINIQFERNIANKTNAKGCAEEATVAPHHRVVVAVESNAAGTCWRYQDHRRITVVNDEINYRRDNVIRYTYWSIVFGRDKIFRVLATYTMNKKRLITIRKRDKTPCARASIT